MAKKHKYYNISVFHNTANDTKRILKKAMIFKIFAPCGRVGGNKPTTLTIIKFQHLLVLSFSFKK